MTKVLIFGTFSLFTKAHLAMGIKAKELYPDATIYYVPAARSYIDGYNKDIIDIDDKKRIELLQQAIKPFGFRVSTAEIDNTVSGYTYDTVEYHKYWFGGSKIDIIVSIGMDNVEHLIDWNKGVELARENNFLVFTRGEKYNADALKLLKSAEVVNFEEYAKYSSSAAKLAYFNKDYVSLMNIVVPNVYMYLTEEYNV